MRLVAVSQSEFDHISAVSSVAHRRIRFGTCPSIAHCDTGAMRLYRCSGSSFRRMWATGCKHHCQRSGYDRPDCGSARSPSLKGCRSVSCPAFPGDDPQQRPYRIAIFPRRLSRSGRKANLSVRWDRLEQGAIAQLCRRVVVPGAQPPVSLWRPHIEGGIRVVTSRCSFGMRRHSAGHRGCAEISVFGHHTLVSRRLLMVWE